jgi:hypothetical protein
MGATRPARSRWCVGVSVVFYGKIFLRIQEGNLTPMELALKSLADVETLLLKLIKNGSVEDFGLVPTPETIPLKDIKGFDSLSVLEVLTEFEEETGLHFEGEIFYVDVTPKKYLPVHDIATAIWIEIQKGGKSYAGN